MNNGPTEAMNAVIKKVKRVGHGFRNLDNYRLRLLLAVGLDWRTVHSRCACHPDQRLLTTLGGVEPHLLVRQAATGPRTVRWTRA